MPSGTSNGRKLGPPIGIPLARLHRFLDFLRTVLVLERVPSTVWTRACFAMPPPPFSPLLSLLLLPEPRSNGPQRDLHAHKRSQSRENHSTDNRNGTVPTRFSLDGQSGVPHSRPWAIASARSPNGRPPVAGGSPTRPRRSDRRSPLPGADGRVTKCTLLSGSRLAPLPSSSSFAYASCARREHRFTRATHRLLCVGPRTPKRTIWQA